MKHLGITIAALVAFAAPAAALKGTYIGSGETTCLYAPGGFDSNFVPNSPETSWTLHANVFLTLTFSENGTGTLKSSEETVTGPHQPARAGVNLTSASGSLTYKIKDDVITITVENVKGDILSGVRGGQTYTLSSYELSARAVPAGLVLVSLKPEVETITFSNGTSFPRICDRGRNLFSAGY